VGLFVLGILSAGRQAAFQILIVTLVALAFRKDIVRRRSTLKLSSLLVVFLVAATLIGYMGYIAHARQNAKISASKAEVLEKIFNFDLDPTVDAITGLAGPDVKDGIVEALVYFNSPVNMLPVFVSVDTPRHYFGMLTFPIVARRFEWLYGMSVVTAMAEGADRMGRAGVIGVGWFTAYSAFILDFGYIGCGVLVFLIGLLSGRAWAHYQRERSFPSFMLLLCAYLTVLYLPLLPAISDTNVFLLTIVSVVGWKHHRRRGKGGSRFYAGERRGRLLPRGQVPVQ
jgi:hypothetical protein